MRRCLLTRTTSRRITDNSSDQDAFDLAAPLYDYALASSGYKEKITFMENRKEGGAPAKKERPRSVIWFNPPFSENLKTLVGKKFFKLISKHFPKGSRLSKIFNRSSVKVNYIVVCRTWPQL